MKFIGKYIYKKIYSLKYRLLAYLIIATVIPVIFIGSISIYSSYLINNNKVNKGIESILSVARVSLENSLNSLDYASLQLSYVGGIGKKLYSYITSESIYHKWYIEQELQKDILLVSNTNPNLGLVCYLNSNNTLFENSILREEKNFDSLPFFTRSKDMLFYGPHKSLNQAYDDIVFSIIRSVNLPKQPDIKVYIETNIKLFENILEKQSYGMRTFYALVNNNGLIVYSENSESFPIGDRYTSTNDRDNHKIIKNYISFEEESAQGWKILVFINRTDYNREIYNWYLMYLAGVVITISFNALLSLTIWRMVYRPLLSINNEVQSMMDSQFDSELKVTGIKEFDYILHRFQKMRLKIKDLFLEIKNKENLRRQIEVEKLLFQINPHFLHNTLNSIQWIARMNGQTEIDRLLSALTKLLHYNLGKEGSFSTVEEEINALKDYVKLQLARQDNQFEVLYCIDESIKDKLIPRFILQPIVENSIIHGLAYKEGTVRVCVEQSKNSIHLIITDNGKGMKQDLIEQILSGKYSDNRGIGMGIGFSYVIQTIKFHYEDKCKIKINSNVNEGTTVIIDIPVNDKG